MMLSLKHKFLFVHIAKTGGTSIRAALTPLRWAELHQIPIFICSKLSGMSGHRIGAKFPRHAKAIAAKEMLPHELYSELFKFVFVRNPWDLQVSSWHHIRRERPHLLKGVDTFDEFIRWKLDSSRPYQFHIDTSIEHQSDYLVDLHGNEIVDFIGRYERLVDDFNTICEHIGIHPRQLPHRRQAKDRDDYRSYYSDTLAQQVGDYFRADIKRFGYSF
ncbi:MAG: sulfotransferase family protein [Gammaproteobacteria bacterium]|nr:sulfotransferase family protein [Gammaproteobacteria bacterium]